MPPSEAWLSYQYLSGVLKTHLENPIRQFWKSTQGRKSDKRRQDQKNEAKRYFFPYFKDKKFARLKEEDVNGYWAWRRNYWTHGDGAKIKKRNQRLIERARKKGIAALSKDGKRIPALGNVVDHPSQKSCDMAASHLREVWKWAVANGHAQRVIEIDSKRQDRKRKASNQYGASDSRRGWWTDDEYRRLTRYLRSWSVGKGDGDDLSKLNHRHLYGRRLLRDYFLFMSNSGLRTGEATGLRWKNVKFDRKLKDGTTADKIMLTEGKTGSRTVVIRDQAGEVLRRRMGETEFTKRDDLVFCSIDGNRHGDFAKVFVEILEHLDMREDEFGSRRTLYSARHDTPPTTVLAFMDVSAKSGENPYVDAFGWATVAHSVQYLAIVLIFHVREKQPDGVTVGDVVGETLGFYLKCLVLGYLLFQVLPYAYAAIGFPLASSIFVVAAAINIHHFIVGRVIWRQREDPNMKVVVR